MPHRASVVLFVSLAFGRPALAQSSGPAWADQDHVRAGTNRLASLLADGRSRSATLQALSEAIDSTRWVVFLQEGHCPQKVAVACLLHLVGRYESAPYMRVIVDTRRGHPDTVIAFIAHELQHALEVEQAGGVTDGDTMRRLFQRIGFVSASSAGAILYETHDARRMEDQVRRELDAARPASAAQTGR